MCAFRAVLANQIVLNVLTVGFAKKRQTPMSVAPGATLCPPDSRQLGYEERGVLAEYQPL